MYEKKILLTLLLKVLVRYYRKLIKIRKKIDLIGQGGLEMNLKKVHIKSNLNQFRKKELIIIYQKIRKLWLPLIR